MLDGKKLKYVYIVQGVAQGCTLPPNLFKTHIIDSSSRSSKAGSHGKAIYGVGDLMFADDVVGISETPEGLQKQKEKAQENAGKWRVVANVNK